MKKTKGWEGIASSTGRLWCEWCGISYFESSVHNFLKYVTKPLLAIVPVLYFFLSCTVLFYLHAFLLHLFCSV